MNRRSPRLARESTMAKSEKVPVAVHRWFADGEGWAHDPSLAASSILELMQVFDRELKGFGEEQFAAAALDGWVIGERRCDPDTEDPLAKHRSPTVFRVAFLNDKPSDQHEALLRKRLAHVLPTVRGIQPLTIEWPLTEAAGERPVPVANPPSAGTADDARRARSTLLLALSWRVSVRFILFVAAVLLVRQVSINLRHAASSSTGPAAMPKTQLAMPTQPAARAAAPDATKTGGSAPGETMPASAPATGPSR